jgi:hypothetical protein
VSLVQWLRSTARESAYLALGLLTSVAAFTVLVAGLTTAGVLAITIVGLPVILGFFLAARGVAELERRRAAIVVGPVPSRYRPSPAPGLMARFKTAAGDPSTWHDILWLFFASVLGFAGGVAVLTLWFTAGYLVTLPLYWWLLPQSALPRITDAWILDSWGRITVALAAGLALAFLTFWFVRWFARGQAHLARLILAPGKRAHLETRVDELATTRRAAADTQTEELRRIERDLHDGAQARLVALAIDLGMAREKLDTEPEAARALMDSATEDAKAALTELRELVRGVHPAVLHDRGLDGALAALAARSPVPVTLEIEPGERPAPALEAAAYFVVAEGLANVAKHSGAAHSTVRVQRPDGKLVVEVADDGAGGASIDGGSGIAGLEHRVRALDGALAVQSPTGGPTLLRVELPCAS